MHCFFSLSCQREQSTLLISCMETKSILTVEDDFSFALELEISLSKNNRFTVVNATSAKDALSLVQSNSFDAILLDLYLKGPMSGIDLGNLLKDAGIPIIIITSHADESLYKLTRPFSPVAYLVKPFNPLTLISTLDSAIASKSSKSFTPKDKNKDEMLVRSNGQLHRVKFDNITHINSDGNYCIIHTATLRFAIKKSLKRLFEELPTGQFIRIHKSYVVQAELIENVDLTNRVLFLGEIEIPFGKRFRKDLIDRMSV